MLQKTLAPLLLLTLVSIGNECRADIIIFNLLDDGNAGTQSAGEALESSGSFSFGGITLTVQTTTTGGLLTSSFSTNTGGAGVNTDGLTSAQGDEASRLDSFESIEFTITGSDFFLTEFDFNGVGAENANDAALVTIGGSTTTLETGSPNFNGSSDTWTPPGGIFLSDGSTITIGAEDRIGLEAFTIETVTAVPEPTSLGLLGVIAGGYLVRRRLNRRKQKSAA